LNHNSFKNIKRSKNIDTFIFSITFLNDIFTIKSKCCSEAEEGNEIYQQIAKFNNNKLIYISCTCKGAYIVFGKCKHGCSKFKVLAIYFDQDISLFLKIFCIKIK
jgi:hypothetical protein